MADSSPAVEAQKPTTLKAFVDDNHKLMSVIGVFAALVVFANATRLSTLSGLISVGLVTCLLLLWIELLTLIPREMAGRLSGFQWGAQATMFIIFIYWFLLIEGAYGATIPIYAVMFGFVFVANWLMNKSGVNQRLTRWRVGRALWARFGLGLALLLLGLFFGTRLVTPIWPAVHRAMTDMRSDLGLAAGALGTESHAQMGRVAPQTIGPRDRSTAETSSALSDSNMARVRGTEAGDKPERGVSWEKLLTFVGLIVIPLVAAWVGAREGGRQARKAAAEEQQRQAAEEDARLRRELLHVFRVDVEELGLASADLDDSVKTITPFMPTLGNNLDEISRGFLARRSSVFLIEGPEERQGVESFYRKVARLRGWVAGWYQEERDARDPNLEISSTSTSPNVVVGAFRNLANEGSACLEKLKARYPELGVVRGSQHAT